MNITEALNNLHIAISGFKNNNGDVSARYELVQAIGDLVDAKICDAQNKASRVPDRGQVMIEDTLANRRVFDIPNDGDYETLLLGSPQVAHTGAARLTCAACGGLMVAGLCSVDAGHGQ